MADELTPVTQTIPRPRAAPTRRSPGRWLKRTLLGVAGAAVLVAIVFAWLPKPVAVDVAELRRAPLDVEVSEDGFTRVRDRFVVSSPISGNLVRIELEAGAPVAAGDVVASVEPPSAALLDPRTRSEAQARLEGALARKQQADIAVTRAEVAERSASRDAARARRLVDAGAIPGVELEDAADAQRLAKEDLAAAVRGQAVAAADVAAARAVLAGAGEGDGPSGALPVRAPASGLVLRVLREDAGPVAAGEPLLEIGDPTSLEVVVDVLSSDAARIQPGMPARIEAWGGDSVLPGRVSSVEPSAFTKVSSLGVEEQRVNVILAVEQPSTSNNPTEMKRAGEGSRLPAALGDRFRVEAHVVLWHGDDVPVIPTTAMFRHRGAWAVYALEEGRARLRPIEIGHRGRTAVEVVRGLEEGAQVILHPGDRVEDGARVKPRTG